MFQVKCANRRTHTKSTVAYRRSHGVPFCDAAVFPFGVLLPAAGCVRLAHGRAKVDSRAVGKGVQV